MRLIRLCLGNRDVFRSGSRDKTVEFRLLRYDGRLRIAKLSGKLCVVEAC